MTYLVLSDEQARILTAAKDVVALRDSAGRHLGYVDHGITDQEIATARARLGATGERYSTAEVLEHLQGLAQ